MRLPFLTSRSLARCAVALPLLAVATTGLQAQQPRLAAPAASSMSALPLDRIAAVVGTKAILLSDVEAAVVAQQLRIPDDSAGRMELLRGVLDQLVDMEVLVQKAELDTALRIDDAELEGMADEQLATARRNFATDAEFRAALVEAGFGTPEEYKRRQVEQIRRERLYREYIAALKRDGKFTTVNVSERDVNAELERQMDNLPQRPAIVGFQQILVPTVPGQSSRERARKTIDSLYLKLRDKPNDFEEVARQVSQDGAAAEGGDLGWNRRGVMVPEFDRVMFMLNPGIVSPPVETRFGWHLIRVDRVQPAEVKARHILIRAEIDSVDQALAASRADSVRAMWERGVSFDSLRAEYHDNRSGEDAIVPEVAKADLPAPYAEAIGDLPAGSLIGPFEIEDQASGSRKFVVLKLTRAQPAGTMTLDEARQSLRRSMQEAYSIRRLIDTLRKQTYVSLRL
ncbi:MAG TPA: peptidylprolyl isomerase [Gemmatimonadaceae bacterium]|nr:peptidylprolyl isomerase [Gemmatimonadaceae bacterium]